MCFFVPCFVAGGLAFGDLIQKGTIGFVAFPLGIDSRVLSGVLCGGGFFGERNALARRELLGVG